ncbi:xanthine dehydrogenase family protein molybdopterin-binding subunit [Bradyrhizobium sp. LHD-71]|uniref:xanthine dehydrogenase family protein molybdopterin-binding subunit n=1 Tax=Bradyrhizobium sp. LHD-71 TaxID=3072141 RepID=UPI00280F92D6|nr:xanthine dehydrogenase family protein molybdopterin-binding subunit [Bradyrhizobium sp. LHD-71]MDQ8731057.1 xanthine dehydrogenase family protein molybdopterin-binding subunit [Bradyrhizobium sp. LHD-71]
MQDHLSSRSVENTIAAQKYGIGQPVVRKEDDTLVRGKGRYTDDLNLSGQAHAVMVRSTHPHGVLRKVDVTEAKTMPGVLGIWTGEDMVAAGYGNFVSRMPLKSKDGSPLLQSNKPILAVGKVRFVGDPIAVVVAGTLAQAKDAAEAVSVDIDPLPAVTRAEDAIKPDAPQLYESVPNNMVLDFHYGDTAKVDDAFAKAAHVARLDLDNTRVAVVAMEPRSGIGVYDKARDFYTLHVPTQGVAGNRILLATLLKVKAEQIRILTGNVGGSFGMKSVNYPEYTSILHASKMLGRPVKWTDERSGSFLSDSHGRASEVTAELALDKDGHFLAVRVKGFGNVGGYLAGVMPSPLSLGIAKNIASVYKTRLIEVNIKCVLTNTSVMGAYRGAGRPEANYFMERLIERAAEEMNIDRIALRKKNLVKSAQMPFMASSGLQYDSGDFPGVMANALTAADYAGFARRKKESRKRGKLRGIAVGAYLEVTAPPSKELGKIVFDKDGGVTLITGTLDYGQGHASPYAQVLAERLGVPFEKIRLVQGDSDVVHAGNGTGGSRSITASGQAIVEASDLVIEKGKQAAAHILEAASADIEFSEGHFNIVGTDRGINILDLAKQLQDGQNNGGPASLDVDHVTGDIQATFPNGCHVAEVEVDPETGTIAIVKYTGINDFGVVVNPLMVAGQVHGGVAQGIGQALMECVSYDESGQPVTGSLMDYALPRAVDIPEVVLDSHPSPATTNPLGTKGCGEAGCAGSLSTVVNAVMDALAEVGVKHINMPLTPERVWQAIQQAKSKAA